MSYTIVYRIDNGKITDSKVAKAEYSGNAQKFAEDFRLDGEWVEISEQLKPGIGRIFNEEMGIYIDEQPYASWTFDEEILSWIPPVAWPENRNEYEWDENSGTWQIVS